METYALYGPSGTGKSTSALHVAHNKKIPAIIDDGILIYRGRKIAGVSAKYEKNTIQAVKRAIFFYDDHANSVRQAIKELDIDKILILGTSKKMVDRIARTLEIEPIHHYIPIEEIRSSSEIKAALYTRKTEGKHVIPIPYIQVEQDFFSRLIAQGKKIFSPRKEVIGEHTIVQPDFQAGRIHINESVLKKIIILSCSQLPETINFGKIDVALSDTPTASVRVHVIVPKGTNLLQLGAKIRKRIADAYVEHLNIELNKIDVLIEKINLLPS
jgi:adenylate kinase family enzyme/uncharacterized alkaline shock family protein YloU